MKKFFLFFLFITISVLSLYACMGASQQGESDQPLSLEEPGGNGGLLRGGQPASVLRYGDIITLQSNHFRYYLNKSGEEIRMAPAPFAWEKWVILYEANPSSREPVMFNDKVILKSFRFGSYLGGNDNDSVKTAAVAQSWEKWIIIDANNSGSIAVSHNAVVAFKQAEAFQGSPYLSVTADHQKGRLAGALDSWEKWIIGKWAITQGNPSDTTTALKFGDIITLKAGSADDYLSAKGDRSTWLSRYPQAWERWEIVAPPGSNSTGAVKYNQTVLLRSVSFDYYLSGQDDMSIDLSPNRQSWEEWKFINKASPSSAAEVTINTDINLLAARFAGNPRYLSGDLDARASLSPNRDAWEVWSAALWVPRSDEKSIHYGDMITLQSNYFKNFAGGRGDMGELPQSWEQWRVINPTDAASTAPVILPSNDLPKGSPVLLYNPIFNAYLSGDPNNKTISLSPNQWAYELWRFIDGSNPPISDSVAKRGATVIVGLYNYDNKYLSGSRSSLSVSDWAMAWEKWTVFQTWVSPRSWMKNIDSEMMTSRLTIPGTHDSGTYVYAPLIFIKTQKDDIARQLNKGVRFLDIRAMKSGNPLYSGALFITHGMGSLISDLTVNEVIADCKEFLRQNPSETIFFSLKKDADPWPDFSGSNLSFYETFMVAHDADPDLWYIGNYIPKLSEVRGKIVLLNRMQDGDKGLSISIGNNQVEGRSKINDAQWLECEDRYDPVTDQGKKDSIQWHLEKAQADLKDPTHVNTLWMTFTSANKAAEPWTGKGPEYFALSGGNWLTGYWLNINGWLMDTAAPEKGPMGIVPMDFPEDWLINRLLRGNEYCFEECAN